MTAIGREPTRIIRLKLVESRRSQGRMRRVEVR